MAVSRLSYRMESDINCNSYAIQVIRVRYFVENERYNNFAKLVQLHFNLLNGLLSFLFPICKTLMYTSELQEFLNIVLNSNVLRYLFHIYSVQQKKVVCRIYSTFELISFF